MSFFSADCAETSAEPVELSAAVAADCSQADEDPSAQIEPFIHPEDFRLSRRAFKLIEQTCDVAEPDSDKLVFSVHVEPVIGAANVLNGKTKTKSADNMAITDFFMIVTSL